MSLYDPLRMALEILHWRNREWLDMVQEDNKGAQLHCRKLKVWRWEQLLIRNFGRDWEELALDKAEWEERASSLCAYR